MIIKRDQDVIRSYFEDSSNLKGGHAEAVILPESAEELSAFLSEASARRTPVTVAGGGTGTTGSRIPFGGVIVSMERFSKILDISKEGMSGIAQAGVLVEDFKNACEREGLFYTCHPTERTAFLGGTAATNASGARSFKYGPTRKYVQAMEMVLADGRIFSIRRGDKILTKRNSAVEISRGIEIPVPFPTYEMPSVKSSAGYFARDGMDALDLFIGQEGTLSVITRIEFALVEKPSKIFGLFIFFKNEEEAWNFSNEVKKLSKQKPDANHPPWDILSIEYLDSYCVNILRMSNGRIPESSSAAVYVEELISSPKEEEAAPERWLGLISRHGMSADDAWIAATERDVEEFARFRHSIPEGVNDIIRRCGFRKVSIDIAVPDKRFLEMMRYYRDTLNKTRIEHAVFGHIGECHLHVNLLPGSQEELDNAKEIALLLVRKGVALGGTVSAEHGIGKLKHDYLKEMYGEKGIIEMAAIKKAFDPHCILGLDNIFPRELLKGL